MCFHDKLCSSCGVELLPPVSLGSFITSVFQMTDNNEPVKQLEMEVPITINVEEPETVGSASVPPVFAVPGDAEAKNVESSSTGGGIKVPNLPPSLGVPPQKSLLGADLTVKPASLAMPPPTSSGRKVKYFVRPGMSMVKWMALQANRARPLTRRKISLAEIAKHCTESDCWMAIRDCVYDVTEYIPYHPGGIPELMKGAGKDATALFNEVHRWVNVDSILRSCFVGYLQVEAAELFDVLKDNTLVPLARAVDRLPVLEFSQNDSDLILQVDAKGDDDELSDDHWYVSVLNRERLLLKVILKPPDLWMAHLKLHQALRDDSLCINFQSSFKRAVITIKKPSIGKWESIGLPLEDNNKLMDSRSSLSSDDFILGTLVEKEYLTHDVVLLVVDIPTSSHIGVPLGFHVSIRLLDGVTPARKYTPVQKYIHNQPITLTDSNIVASTSSEITRKLYFVIKLYQDGQLTKNLSELPLNSQLEVGKVAGRLSPCFFSSCDTLAMFAGGSGITPFMRVVDFLLNRSETYPVKNIILVFFNHTEKDIICHEQWTKLSEASHHFHYFPVISSPNESWGGLSGRVDSVPLFETILAKTLARDKCLPENIGKFKAMLCGSSGFNAACVTMLRNQTTIPGVAVTEEDSSDLFIF